MDQANPLIDAVTSSLAENEPLRDSVNSVLGEAFVADHPCEAKTIERLEKTGQRNNRILWRALLWGLALVVLLGALIQHRSTLRLGQYVNSISLFYWELPPMPEGLTEQQRLLLGDPLLDEVEQTRRLHLSDPENPAYYAEYACRSAAGTGELPPDYFETVRRIAPDNAFFLYFAAAQMGAKSVERNRSAESPDEPRWVDGVALSPYPHESAFEIIDRDAYEEALGWVAKAASLPNFTTYSNRMIVERIRLLPSRNFVEFTVALMHAYGHAIELIALRKVADLICARAEELSKRGETEAFLGLVAQHEALMAGLMRNEDVLLVGELIHQVIALTMAGNLHAASERLGLVELAEKFRTRVEELQAMRDRREIRSSKQEDLFHEGRASAFVELSLRLIQNMSDAPPPIRESELRPMRMVEHELVAGMGVLALAVLMLLCSFAASLCLMFVPRRIRIPAKRLAQTFGVADWCRVLLAGVALPLAFFLFVTRMTPLGGRDFGIGHFMFVFPGVHIVGLWIALIVAPAVVVGWFLPLRLGSFGFRKRDAMPSMVLMAVVTLMGMSAYPLLVGFGLNAWTLSVLGLPVLWFLGVMIRFCWGLFFGQTADRLRKAAVVATVTPAHLVAVIALCMVLPIHLAAEKRWMAEETLLRVDPEAADLGAYEYKVASELRRQMQAIMGF